MTEAFVTELQRSEVDRLSGGRDGATGTGSGLTAGGGTPAAGAELDINRIMQMIPHRYPMLMVDRLIDVHKGQSAIGIKNVTLNEPFFQGHFPGRPVMPGVLIIESMAQTAGVVVVHALGSQFEGKLVYFMTIEEARFRRPVVPGDRLMIHVTKVRHRGTVWKFRGEAKVDDVLCAEAVFTAMILDEEAA